MPKSLLSLCLAVGVFVLAGCGGPAPQPKFQWHADSFPPRPASLNAIAGQKGAAPNSSDTFRFVVMADRNAWQEPGKWAQAVGEVNLLKPDFVMCVGDLARGYKEEPPKLAEEWNEFHAENKGMQAPFFYTPGNHDVLGVETRKTYSRLHNTNGTPYYSFDYRGCHFVVIDTTCIVENPDEAALADAQWEWLAKDLSSANAKQATQVFIFMHFPLWNDYAGAKKNSRPQWVRLRDMINPKKTTMFAGHTHELLYTVRDGVPCHTLAVTAAKASGDLSRGEYQMFTMVTVDSGKPTIAHIPVGQVMPANASDIFAQRSLNAIMDQAVLTSVSEKGGQALLTLSNTSRNEVTYQLAWSDKSGNPSKLPQAEAAIVPVGESVKRSYEFPAISSPEAPALKMSCTYSFHGRTYSASRDLPLTVVREYEAVRGEAPDVQKPIAGGLLAGTAGADGSMTWKATYDDRNLYVTTEIIDDKIVTDTKQPYDRDGVQIFFDPRPADQQTGPFKNGPRQLIMGLPADGQPLQVVVNPEDKALAGAVKAEWTRTAGGYRMVTAIPLASFGADIKAGPGTVLRMDIYAGDRDDESPKGVVRTVCISGKVESSRQTGHYARIVLK